MSKKILAEGIMTETVVVANTTNSFDQVMEFFTKHRLHHLPVTENEKLLGIISMSDMLKFIDQEIKSGRGDSSELTKNFKINEVMTNRPVTVSPDAPLLEILDKLVEGKFQALPVSMDGDIKGIVTTNDIVRVYHWDLMH